MNGAELLNKLSASLQDAILLQRRQSARHRSNGLKYQTYQQGAGGATHLSLHNFKFLRNCSTTPAYAGEGGSSSG
jgi:hypothetical protein